MSIQHVKFSDLLIGCARSVRLLQRSATSDMVPDSTIVEEAPMTLLLPIELATRQAGVLHRRQLRDAGIDRRSVTGRVRRGELIEIATEVFVVVGTDQGWRQRLWSGLLTARTDAVISRRSGARLHHHGRFSEAHVDVLEVENTDHRLDRATGHRSSWVPPHHRTQVDGIPVTTPARTVFDLVGMVSPKRKARGWPTVTRAEATRALDDALASGVPLSSFHEVLDTLATRGRPGTVLMRELLTERGDGYVATESELEDLLHHVLQSRGMPIPQRQRVLGSAHAAIGRVDFAYPTQRVVIEADGRRHHTALIDAEADRWRDLELASAGWIVVRVTWRQLQTDPGRFVRTLRTLLEARTD